MAEKDSSYESDLELIGSLWVREGKKGKFFSGKLEGIDGQVMIFKNTKPKNAMSPEYFIFKAPPKEQQKQPAQKQLIVEPIDDDDIPF